MATDPLDRALAALGSSASISQHASNAFETIAHGTRKVVICGCGHLGTLTLAGARTAGLEVVALADNAPALWGRTLSDVPVIPPGEAVAKHNHEAFFVVAIHNGTSSRRQLAELGCTRIVPYPMFFWQFAHHMPQEDRLELPPRILARLDEIRCGYALLRENRTREEFAAQIAWRCSLDYGLLAAPDPASAMYFASDIVHLSNNEVLVDCGAFDGDSIRMFLHRTSGVFEQIYALEPDAQNRVVLEQYLATLPDAVRARIHVFPFGVADFTGTASFDSSGTAGSRIAPGRGTAVIECKRLDDLLNGSSVTIIKMDIEGAEPGALRGASRIIRRTRPILAVCAYHKCEHLWTLPRIIADALPDYEIFLRRYAEECWETVYYAVPPERAISGISR